MNALYVMKLAALATNEVKTKSWFASIACMKHLCDYWSIMSAILDIALQFGAALYLNFAG